MVKVSYGSMAKDSMVSWLLAFSGFGFFKLFHISTSISRFLISGLFQVPGVFGLKIQYSKFNLFSLIANLVKGYEKPRTACWGFVYEVLPLPSPPASLVGQGPGER